MEAVLLPGILDGLSGRLSMMPPGVVDQPTSAREGISRRWAASLREAVMTTEGREANPDQITPHVVHPALHQDYELDFWRPRVDDIAPTLTSPMLVGIASSVHLSRRPAVPKGPESPTEEMEEIPPPHDVSLPRGMKEKDLLPRRYEVFASDYEWVQSVRGSLLGLEAGDSPSRREIEDSSRFQLRMVASEMEPPEVIVEHWLPTLRREGLLVECSLDQFTTTVDWILLYTCEGLQKYLFPALSAFPSQGVPSLIAVAPPEVHVGTDKEFLLCNFH